MTKRTWLLVLEIGILFLFFAPSAFGVISTNEQTAVLNLVISEDADVIAVVDGQWDNPLTWGGLPPGDGDDVLIPAGRIVQIDSVLTVRLNSVRVDGLLTFAPTEDTRLLVETIVVTPTGVLEIGHPDSPITGSASVVFLDGGPLSSTLERGLLSLGMVSICGADAPIWDRLEAMANDGRTRPTGLDRTVTLTSEAADPARRGHVMLMHHADYEVCHARFVGLGRTNKDNPISATNPRGRYALHFHRCGKTTPIFVEGVVIEDSPGWGLVNHSSYVIARDCVSYDCLGAGFVGEAGDERGVFENCLAVYSRGSGDVGNDLRLIDERRKNIKDFGHVGHGFWLQGPGVALVDNFAIGHAGGAFVRYGQSYIEPDTGINTFPLAEFAKIATERGNFAARSFIGFEHSYCSSMTNAASDLSIAGCEYGYLSIKSFAELTGLHVYQCDVGQEQLGPYGGPNRILDSSFTECLVGVRPSTSKLFGGVSLIEATTFTDCGAGLSILPGLPGRCDMNALAFNNAPIIFERAVYGGTQALKEQFFYRDTRAYFFDSRRAYFPEQHPDYVPFTAGQYAGRSNLEIFVLFGKQPLGKLIPVAATNQGEFWLDP